ncbi:pectate lyase [Dyadobacter luteus]|uniref:Pectate lyase n=1 Tax=Dyadobacter luteus TaxID=2259619 RepID=A0A3D8Y591_9BACT|nr:pectate lyase [Dyadobacter luteus]REA56884.1 pectate lyase [Dyadobacter luteus]
MNRLSTFFLGISLLTGTINTFAGQSVPLSDITKNAVDSTAEKMLIAQRVSGGWPKQIDTKAFNYNYAWSPEFTERIKISYNHKDATIDNHATSREIRHLVKAYEQTGNTKYLNAAETGIRYLLKMQYKNGGFPQFFPDTSGYRKHITYNDDAMLNALRVLESVAAGKAEYGIINKELKTASASAVKAGIDCILKTQIRVNGKPTVWCAQHDHITYKPANARAFELASFSAGESVDITRFLMEIPNPTPEIKEAIVGALTWLDAAAIEGYQTKRIKDAAQPKGQDVVLMEAPGERIWARFYDLETGKPFFCGRDGIKREKLSEIENERRVGYAYYGTWPAKLLSKKQGEWQPK